MRPWLLLPPALAHSLSPAALHILSRLHSHTDFSWQPFEWRGLKFRNRLGIAGGLDKTGENLLDWWRLGAGFLELGTVTPLPQTPNPGKIFGRNRKQQALWNKMGFPSPGVAAVHSRLENLEGRPHPLLINIGKNRATPNETAADDYLACMRGLEMFADGFVVNISSPNTTGLRDLSSPERLPLLLETLRAQSKKPLLLKLSPDVEAQAFETMLKISLNCGVDGWILTNTTTQRPNDIGFALEGGMSGQPLAQVAKEKLQHAVQFLGSARGDRLLISVGGVMTTSDVVERLQMGADLVQVYSTLIFNGPYFFIDCARASLHI